MVPYFEEDAMKLIAWDLEIAKPLPEPPEDDPYSVDWRDHRPLGITCAVACFKNSDGHRFKTWHGAPQMDKADCQDMVNELLGYTRAGFTIVTFNGLGFDFQVLAEESGMGLECADMAMNHIDIMFQWFCRKGWHIGLDNTCEANNVKGKLKEVTLNSGEVITEIDGADAPRLWAEGEHEAVLAYAKEDVRSLLDLAHVIQVRNRIHYVSKSNKNYTIRDGLIPVKRALNFKEPYTAWMSNPRPRIDFYGWVADVESVEAYKDSIAF
jgi:hypothetical protein